MNTTRLPGLLSIVTTFLMASSLVDLRAQRAEGKPGPPRAEEEHPAPRRGEGGNPAREAAQLEQSLERLRAQLKALAAGNDANAASVKEEVVRVERALDDARARAKEAAVAHEREHEREDGELQPGEIRPGRAFGKPGEVQREEMERRLQHLHAAIKNLHAAGFHDPAERLTEQAERMESALRETEQTYRRPGPRRRDFADFQGDPPGRRRSFDGPFDPDAVAPLREEIRQLHDEIRALNRRIDELSREKR